MTRLRIVLTLFVAGSIAALVIPLAIIATRTRGVETGLAGAGTSAGNPLPDVRTFALTDHRGQRCGTAELRGKLVLLYFGYTFCPDICPTELGYLAKVMRGLGADAQEVVPVFVTVDPERDSQQVLAEYVTLFDPRLIGLRGTPAEIDAMATAYGVMHQKTQVVTKQAGYYLIDHTSTIFVLDRHGRIADTLDSDTSIPVAVARLRRLLP